MTLYLLFYFDVKILHLQAMQKTLNSLNMSSRRTNEEKHKGYPQAKNSTQDDETQMKIILYDNEAKCLSL